MKTRIYARVGNADQLMKNQKVKTICYGKEEIWNSREEAKQFFLRALAGSEGSEQNRYSAILAKLEMGLDICSDEG